MQLAHINVTEPQSIAAFYNLEKDFMKFVQKVQNKNMKRYTRPRIPQASSDRGHLGQPPAKKFCADTMRDKHTSAQDVMNLV